MAICCHGQGQKFLWLYLMAEERHKSGHEAFNLYTSEQIDCVPGLWLLANGQVLAVVALQPGQRAVELVTYGLSTLIIEALVEVGVHLVAHLLVVQVHVDQNATW